MKRPLIWFSLSLMAGLYCYTYAAKQLLFCGFLFCLLCIGLFLLKKSPAFFSLILFFGLGIFLLFARETILIDRPARLHQTTAEFAGTVSAIPREGNSSYSYELSLSSLNGKKSCLKLWVTSDQALQGGDVVSGTGVLSSSKKMNDQGFGEYLIGQGISFSCNNPKLTRLTPTGWNKIRYAPLRLRQSMISLLNRYTRPPWRGIFVAITTGDRSDLTSVQQERFSKTGTSHILSVSGLHVSVLLFAAMKLLRGFRIPYPLDRWLCLPIPLFLALFMGGQAPVLRACIMGFLFLLAECVWAESDSVNSLFFSAFLILLFRPDQLFRAGFLLSFSSTFGIVAFFPVIQRFLKRYITKSEFADLIAVSLSSYFTSCMVLLSFYQGLPAVTLLSNILIVPLFPLLLAGVFVFSGVVAIFPVLAPVGNIFLTGIASFLFRPLELLEKCPVVELAISGKLFVAAYCFLIVFCYFLTLRRKNWLVLFCFVFCFTTGGVQQHRFSRYDSLTLIDAGCINSVLIRSQEGRTLLLAGVSGENQSYLYDYQDFLNYFQKNNIRTIDVFYFMNYNKNTVALFRDLGRDRLVKQYLLLPDCDLSDEIQRLGDRNHSHKTDFTQPFALELDEQNRCELYPTGTVLWYQNDILIAEFGKNPKTSAFIIGRPTAETVTIYGQPYSKNEWGTLHFLIRKGSIQRMGVDTLYEQGGLP